MKQLRPQTSYLSLSTDEVSALVELARHGSLRAAAEHLLISEQGVRNRLIALEGRLGVELYRKSRGVRRTSPLTEQGRTLLPQAIAFLERARELGELFTHTPEMREVHVAASHYLTLYVLIDAVRRFHAANPNIRIRLSTRTEAEIEAALLSDPELTIGVAAPLEPPRDVEYRHLFSMSWSLITPSGHPLLRKKRLRLTDLAGESLILFERGSTGRQHVIDALHGQGISPRIDMETTNTEIIVRMVEAGLGISIVPLLPSGVVTRGRRVGVLPLGDQIRPINSGILTRRGEKLPAASESFLEFVQSEWSNRGP